MPSSVLGPHVVGERIVVRRILPGETGPSGGPAFTDVLGICLEWSDGECRIQPAEGPAITIPTHLIVTGKPVPPRPAVRLRVGVRASEMHAFPIWPEVTRTALGEWELRVDGAADQRERRIKRADSALALGDPGVDLAVAADRVKSAYAEVGRQPLIQTELGSETEAELIALGWEPVEGADTVLMIGSISRGIRLAGVRNRHTAPPTRSIDGPRLTSATETAHGDAALDVDWLGISSLWVDPEHRRQGQAHLILADLMSWGAEEGAQNAWLHVELDNLGARELYGSLGFQDHHKMRYLALPDSPA